MSFWIKLQSSPLSFPLSLSFALLLLLPGISKNNASAGFDSTIPSLSAGTLPGFSPGLKSIGVDEVDCPENPALDLTVFCAGEIDDKLVFRIGTREALKSTAGIYCVSTRVADQDFRILMSSSGKAELQLLKNNQPVESFPVDAEYKAMPGAVVGEFWLDIKDIEPSIADWLVDPQLSSLESRDSIEAYDKIQQNRDGERAEHHVAFVHHGNQGLTWTDVLWGHEEFSHEQHWDDYLDTDSEHNGFDEILGLHDLLDVPANFQVAGPLQTAAEWYYPDGDVEGWNDWLARGVTEGWAAILSSAYAQHIMPFATDSMNNWAVHVQTDMSEWRYGYTPHVAWVPERVWVSPIDGDGNGTDTGSHVNDWIGDNWLNHDVWAVILDQDEHCGYENNWSSDRHIYTIDVPGQGTLKVIPINGSFTGNCHHNAGNAWNDILGTSDDELLVYGTDWEVVAEVAGFQDDFASALNNMIWLMQQIAATSDVYAERLDDRLNYHSNGPTDINLQNATYGLLGGQGGYGSDWLSPGTHNSWYSDWAAAPAHSDQHTPQWDYGTVWNNTRANLMSCPSNDLSELGWYVFMTNMYETGWHDGEDISGWIHRYASHIKNANVYAEASRWVNGDYTNTTSAYMSDIDMDGQDEIVLHSDRVFAVFETTGGRAPWIFAKGAGYDGSVVGSCNAYWVDTDGDYNDGLSNNHVAAFSDVSPYLENELYTMSVDTVGIDFATITLSHDQITKSFTLRTGNPYIQVDYEVSSGEVFIKHGFTPDYMDLLWNADSERLWDPNASWPAANWMGQRNPNTSLTAALVLGNGGALHNSDFQGTLVRGDEIKGNGAFRYFFYAGESSAPDVNGLVAELETLGQTNMDVSQPRVNETASFVGPYFAVVDFNEAVDESSAELIANYSLSGFPGGASIQSAERQADWSLVYLQISGLNSGDSGAIIISGVTDLNGNTINPDFNSALLNVPDGLTPHSILIDGNNDFTRSSEWMGGSPDSLFITWDSVNLYLSHYGTDLALGDLFIYLDTDLQSSSGAAGSSWGRVIFATANRPEYEIAIEGGGNSMQINSYTSSWNYVQYDDHNGQSYEGWSGNLFSEIKIPWIEIGNPEGLAIAVSVSQEDNWTTTKVWPETNSTGSNIEISDWYIFAQPDLPAVMPATGVQPNNLQPALIAVDDLLIEMVGSGQLRLSWSLVSGADSYKIYSGPEAYDMLGSGSLVSETALQEVYLPVVFDRQFFMVVAESD
jgi:hypothetical protein